MLVRMSQMPFNSTIKNSCIQSRNQHVWRKCGFSSQSKAPDVPLKPTISPFPPLKEPLQNLPTPIYSSAKVENREPKISVLSNGLKVVSQDYFGQFATIGVAIDSGPRYEVAYPSGISHFLEKLAFNSTKNFQNNDHIMLSLEKYGGICLCDASRDTFIYYASAERQALNTMTKVLGDIVLRPLLTEEELNLARQSIKFEIDSLSTSPDQERLLLDMIHAAAYRDNTLGFPQICPAENLEKINRQILFTYLKSHYTPSRMVVAGIGVEHERLVEAVQKYFVDEKPIWEEERSLILSKGSENVVDNSVAQYTDGFILEECNIPVHAGPSRLPELSHIVIGLEGCSHHDSDFIPLCVLHTMMGGGGSFSIGGPGKGMYARLYSNVMNRYTWMYSAAAYNHCYGDTGLFYIHASSASYPVDHVREMTEVIVKELVSMAGTITDNELGRAKKQLQSVLLMNLEHRTFVFEDIARQVLATGSRQSPEHFIQEIAKVSKSDINRVACRLLKSPPSVVARGRVRNIPSHSDIQAGLLDAKGRIPTSKKQVAFKI
ncbi:mitochondrial-processing peptidase subunit alpha-like [Belonocnema kinseyi]|uniref:mitochondrial-processing peptidase subunit alpha-like n=1 Tax=Belonocnema kinseyi TaxID=2817044 RepID=UPI00143D7E22|nr:mitochondrial-processing peptidase subunit alpha-like [Belonocnema kinseyi]